MSSIAKSIRGKLPAVQIERPLLKVHATNGFKNRFESLSLAINFGPRYEPKHLSGISHLIRLSAHLTTRNDTKFGLQKFFQTNNIILDVEQQKDLTVYHLSSPPETIIEAVTKLKDMLENPMFFYHEVRDLLNHEMPDDDTRLKMRDPDARLHDMIHRAAFGFNGLGNSSFYHSNDTLHTEHLEEFYHSHFLPSYSFALTSSSDESLANSLPMLFQTLSSKESALKERRKEHSENARQAATECYIDETVNFVKFAYTFSFAHSQSEEKDRLKDFIALRILKEAFRCFRTEYFHSPSIFNKFILAETTISPRDYIVEPILHEYDTHSLLSVKFSVYNKPHVSSLVRAAKKFFANIHEILPKSDCDAPKSKAVNRKSKTISESGELFEKLKLNLKYSEFGQKETNCEVTQMNVRPLFLLGEAGLDFIENLDVVDEKYIFENIVGRVGNQKPCFVALGDCKYLENSY